MPVSVRINWIAIALASLVLPGCEWGLSGKSEAPLPEVSCVTIKSSWVGDKRSGPYSGSPAITEVELRRGPKGYVGHSQISQLNGAIISKRQWSVPWEAVIALQKSLVSQPELSPSLRKLKVHPYLLQSKIDSYISEYLAQSPPETHGAIRAYRHTLIKNEALESMMADGLRFRFYSHDYPSVEVRMYLANGKEFDVSSDFWMAAMTPWQQDNVSNFSPRISTSIAALLPYGSTNRNRLMDYSLEEYQLESVVSNGILNSLDTIVFEQLYPSGLNELKKLFQDPEIGMARYLCSNTNGEICPQARLKLPGAPGSLSLMANLRGENKELRKSDLASYHNMLSQVSRSALMPIIRSNLENRFVIQANRFITWSNPAVREQFVKDMRSISGFSFKNIPIDSLEHAVLVSDESAYWVVFPDGTAVKWMTEYYKEPIVGRPCFTPPKIGEMIGGNGLHQCVGEILPANTKL